GRAARRGRARRRPGRPGERVNLPSISLQIGGAEHASTSVQIVALLTLLSLAPAILVTLTAFVRIVIVLSFLRQAVGTQSMPPNPDDVPPQALLPAFLISELKTAFQMGFLIYVPFLILDMVVASVLTSMGMITLPPVLISLPFKLMLFVLVDGWNVLTGSLVQSFR